MISLLPLVLCVNNLLYHCCCSVCVIVVVTIVDGILEGVITYCCKYNA